MIKLKNNEAPTYLSKHQALFFKGKIYVTGGVNTNDGVFSGDTHIYDVQKGKWETI